MNGGLLEDVRDELARQLTSHGYSIVGNSRLRAANSDISFYLPSELHTESENLLKEVINADYSLPIGDITIQGNIINVHLNRTSTFVKSLQVASLKVGHQKKQVRTANL